MSDCVIDLELLKISLDAANTIEYIFSQEVTEKLGFAVFIVSERGPIVPHSDISQLTLPEGSHTSESFLQKLAITCISTLGFGQEYIEGVLELPSFGIRDHRLILLSTLLKFEFHDNHMEYFQLAMWFPKELLVGIPPISIFEQMLICTIKEEIKCVKELTFEQLVNLKNSLTQLILATTICKNV